MSKQSVSPVHSEPNNAVAVTRTATNCLTELVREISSLGKSWRNKIWEGAAAELFSKIRPCLAELFLRLASITKEESSSLDWYIETLELITSDTFDPVLATFIVSRLLPAPEELVDSWNLQLLDQIRWEQRSLSAFLANRDAYDQLFGTFLPTHLTKVAREKAPCAPAPSGRRASMSPDAEIHRRARRRRNP